MEHTKGKIDKVLSKYQGWNGLMYYCIIEIIRIDRIMMHHNSDEKLLAKQSFFSYIRIDNQAKSWTLCRVKESCDLHIASSRPFVRYLREKLMRWKTIFDDNVLMVIQEKLTFQTKTHYHINFPKLYSSKIFSLIL